MQRFQLEVRDLSRKVTKNPKFDLEQARSAFASGHFDQLKKSILAGVPFAYLLNEAEFYQHSFFVNENVLIPRPETEQLVDKLVQSKQRFKKMLDVGTGSGVILLSLMKAQVAEKGVGGDLSAAALEVAKINANRLRVENVEFKLSDRLNDIHGKFDLIVSNPPYIKPTAHKAGVHAKVDEYEPSAALYIPDASYAKWFEEFFIQVKAHLNPKGHFYMEGHEEELEHQVEVLKRLHFANVQVWKDWNGIDRFLFAQAE